MKIQPLALGPSLALALAASTYAQSEVFELEGHPGLDLVRLGDIDGDGVDDFATSIDSVNVNLPGGGTSFGVVSAHSGTTGARLWAATAGPGGVGGSFGASTTAVGDLDGDGTLDVATTQTGGSPEQTVIRLLSGSTGALIGNTSALRTGAEAWPLVDVADADGDGLRDVLTLAIPGGEACLPGSSTLACSIVLYSTGTGALLGEWYSPSPSESFAPSLAEVGDVDGGGTPDYAALLQNFSGGPDRIRILSAETGTFVADLPAPGARRYFQPTPFADVDGDGVGELAVFSVAGSLGSVAPVVRILSVPTGAVVQRMFPSAPSSGMTRFADQDGDGVDDLLVGVVGLGSDLPQAASGGVEIFSGATGALIGRHLGSGAGHRLGSSLLTTGDLDGDGRPDMIVAGRGWPSVAEPRVVAIRSSAAAGFAYCTFGEVNSQGTVANLGYEGTTSIAQANLTLVAKDVPPDRFGFFLLGTELNSVPNPGGGPSLCIGGSLARLVGPGQVPQAGPDGTARVPVGLQSIPFIAGAMPAQAFTSLYFQFWYRDAAAGVATSVLSNGLATLILP